MTDEAPPDPVTPAAPDEADESGAPDPAQTLAAPAPAPPVEWVTPDPAGAPLTPTVTLPPPDYNAAGVPSLDFVRDKIEGRYAQSLGSTELAEETPEARSVAKQAADREEAARERLEAIRRSLHGDPPS
jgi:hypothetical protein